MNVRRHLSLSLVQQILIGLVLALPVVAAIEASSTYDEECGWGWPRRVSYSDGHGLHKIRDNHGRCRFEVDLKDPVELAADFREVRSVGSGGYLKIRQRLPHQDRRLEVAPQDGAPRYRYWVDGDETPFDAGGRDWLAEVAPRIYRTTGIGAEMRVVSLYEAGGVDAVLAEMDEIDADHVQGIYLRELIGHLREAPGELAAALGYGRREISGDYTLRRVLSEAFPVAALDDEAVREAFLKAARTIDSDYELRTLLRHLMEQDASSTRLEAILEAALSVGSDSEQASILVTALKVLPAAEPLPPTFFEALVTVGSDHEHCRVLAAAFARPGLSAEEADELLKTAARVSGDHALATFLAEVAGSYAAPLPPSYFEALETVASDHAQRQAATAVVERETLDRETASRLLEAVGISSDFEMAGFLKQLAAAYPEDEELPPHFEDALETVGSDFEREKVEEVVRSRRARRPPSPGPESSDPEKAVSPPQAPSPTQG